MDKRKNRNQIQNALNATLSGLQDDPWLAQRVITKGKRKKRMKKKYSVGLVLAIVLVLTLATTALAFFLSMQQVVEQEIVPMAQSNDVGEEINNYFSNEELYRITQLAQENDIDIPEVLLRAVEQGRSEYEEETIMALARETFGKPFAEWTIEQKHWFGEMMVAIGFRQTNDDCLPEEGEISYDQALLIAVNRIAQEYGDDVQDVSQWKIMTDYMTQSGEDGTLLQPKWYFSFVPLDVKNNGYQIILDTSGAVEQFDVSIAPDPESSAADVIRQFEEIYGQAFQWTYTIWADLGRQIAGRDPGTLKGWLFCHAGYSMPPENAISELEAREIALKAVGLEYTTVSSTSCCMVKETPIWKIETHTMFPEDKGTGEYTAIWLLEIDAVTGVIREKREFEVGTGGIAILTRVVPFDICEDESIISALSE
ncbi:MAG: hypothetical protein Q4F18_00470 [Clostridia bacterium]|nr:hypothetical protein [Clostridia bacterium]